MRLHIDREIVVERSLSLSSSKDSMSNSSKKIALVGNDSQGYVHNANILPLNFSVNDHYAKVHYCCISFFFGLFFHFCVIYFHISQICLFSSRTHRYNYLLILRLLLRLKKTAMVFGALLVARLEIRKVPKIRHCMFHMCSSLTSSSWTWDYSCKKSSFLDFEYSIV